MRIRKSVVHAICQCQQCGWKTEAYLSAQKRAAEHARKTGHTVTGDLGLYVRWEPKQRPT